MGKRRLVSAYFLFAAKIHSLQYCAPKMYPRISASIRAFVIAVALFLAVFSQLRVQALAQESADAAENTITYSDPGWLGNVVIWILTYAVFPITVIGIIGATFSLSFGIMSEGKSDVSKFRRGVGAGLPVVLLAFLVVFRPNPEPIVLTLAGNNSLWVQFAYGAAAAIATLEVGKWLDHTTVDALAALNAMWLSTIGAFVI